MRSIISHRLIHNIKLPIHYRLPSNVWVNGVRQYSTDQNSKSRSHIWLGALLATGAGAGYVYNHSKTKAVPVLDNDSRLEKMKEKPTAFNPEAFIPLKLKEVETISHDTHLYRFSLPEGQSSNLPVASCVLVKHTPKDGKPIVRPYTPVSDTHTEGHVDFVIKTYKTGQLTPIIAEMKPGDELEFKGPIPKYNWEKDQKSKVGMVAGGTGITPMLQVIRRVFHEKSNDKKTKITLLFGNQSEKDILLKDELDSLAKKHPDRFKVIYVVDKAPANWTGETGYVNKELIQKYLPGPDEPDTVIMVCGPPGLVKSISGPKDKMQQGELSGVLKELGYVKENVFKF